MSHWRKIERDALDTLGEGVTWSARDHAMYWVDILAPALNCLSLETGEIERWTMPEPLGWVVEDRNGDWIGGFQSGFGRIARSSMAVTPLISVEPHFPDNRMNDGKADRHGAIWCGTMDMAEQHACGSLYRLSPDGRLQVMDSGYMVPNGPAFSPCGQWLYHNDSARRTIFRFSVGAMGLEDKQPFIVFNDDQGYPDGLTTDADGCLWAAHWDGGGISQFSPQGTLEQFIELPARRVTNICFGGERLDRMFVTSASTGLEPSPYDGALFEVESGAIGMPTSSFAGCLSQ